MEASVSAIQNTDHIRACSLYVRTFSANRLAQTSLAIGLVSRPREKHGSERKHRNFILEGSCVRAIATRFNVCALWNLRWRVPCATARKTDAKRRADKKLTRTTQTRRGGVCSACARDGSEGRPAVRFIRLGDNSLTQHSPPPRQGSEPARSQFDWTKRTLSPVQPGRRSG